VLTESSWRLRCTSRLYERTASIKRANNLGPTLRVIDTVLLFPDRRVAFTLAAQRDNSLDSSFGAEGDPTANS
jgi:hypothetical protein